MRTLHTALHTTAAVLGLILFVYSLQQLKATYQFRSDVQAAQAAFRHWVAITKDTRAMYTGTDPETIIAPLNAVKDRVGGWWVGTAFAAAIVACGVAGIRLERKKGGLT